MIGIEKITGRIISDARAYEKAVIDDAEREIAEINDSYSSRAGYIIAKSEDRAEKEQADILARAVSSAEIATRNRLLNARSELIDRVYDEAEKQLSSLPEKEYEGLLTSLLENAVNSTAESKRELSEYYATGELSASDEFIVSFNEKDTNRFGEKVVNTVSGKITAKKVKLSDKPADIEGGFLIVYGNVEINCSIKNLISQIRESTEGKVRDILFKN